MASAGYIASKRVDVILPEVGRDLHPGDDHAHIGVLGAGLVDDALEVAPGVVDGQAAQAVVAAEFEN